MGKLSAFEGGAQAQAKPEPPRTQKSKNPKNRKFPERKISILVVTMN